MRILQGDDVRRLLPVADAVPLMAEAFRLFSSGTGVYPLRTHIAMAGGDGFAMPAYDGEGFGVKLVSVHADNPARGLPAVRALFLLVRAADGEPLMLCEAGSLTAIRTGAASGIATATLARRDARYGALFGVGGQARTQLEAVLAVRPLERVAVYAPHPERVAAFCARFVQETGTATRVVPAVTPADAVRNADIVITATSSTVPVFDGALLREGAHVNAVGAYRRDMRELDSTTIARARVFVDGREAALAEAGDIITPCEEGTITAQHVCGELGEVLLGRVPGRTSNTEITVFKSVGLSVQDVVAASELYRRAEEANAGIGAAL